MNDKSLSVEQDTLGESSQRVNVLPMQCAGNPSWLGTLNWQTAESKGKTVLDFSACLSKFRADKQNILGEPQLFILALYSLNVLFSNRALS